MCHCAGTCGARVGRDGRRHVVDELPVFHRLHGRLNGVFCVGVKVESDPLAYWRLGDSASGTATNAATGPSSLGATANGTYGGTVADDTATQATGSSDSATEFDGSTARVTTGALPATALGDFTE